MKLRTTIRFKEYLLTASGDKIYHDREKFIASKSKTKGYSTLEAARAKVKKGESYNIPIVRGPMIFGKRPEDNEMLVWNTKIEDKAEKRNEKKQTPSRSTAEGEDTQIKHKKIQLNDLASTPTYQGSNNDHMAALAYLPKKYYNAIDTAAKQVCKKFGGGMDYMQDGYHAIIRKIGNLDTEMTYPQVVNWMKKVARNHILDNLKKKRVKEGYLSDAIGKDEDGKAITLLDVEEQPQPEVKYDYKGLEDLFDKEELHVMELLKVNGKLQYVADNTSLTYDQAKGIKKKIAKKLKHAKKTNADALRKFEGERDLFWSDKTGWLTYADIKKKGQKYTGRDFVTQYFDVFESIYMDRDNDYIIKKAKSVTTDKSPIKNKIRII